MAIMNLQDVGKIKAQMLPRGVTVWDCGNTNSGVSNSDISWNMSQASDPIEALNRQLTAHEFMCWVAADKPTDEEIRAVEAEIDPKREWLNQMIRENGINSIKFCRRATAILDGNAAKAKAQKIVPTGYTTDTRLTCEDKLMPDGSVQRSYLLMDVQKTTPESEARIAAIKAQIWASARKLTHRRLSDKEVLAMLDEGYMAAMGKFGADSSVSRTESNPLGYIESNPSRKPALAAYVEDVPQDADSIMDAVRSMSK